MACNHKDMVGGCAMGARLSVGEGCSFGHVVVVGENWGSYVTRLAFNQTTTVHKQSRIPQL